MHPEIQRVQVPVEAYVVGGKTYYSIREAEIAAEQIAENRDPILKFSRTYSGKKLLETMSLDDVGTFLIKNEGPVDYGSSGQPALLKVTHGKLRDVILDAFQTKGFIGYGPGHIELVVVEEV